LFVFVRKYHVFSIFALRFPFFIEDCGILQQPFYCCREIDQGEHSGIYGKFRKMFPLMENGKYKAKLSIHNQVHTICYNGSERADDLKR